ncbi:MAG: hypothetical protein Q7R65_00475 [bacterium]|nr:hypothetical protein [bacterium]
MENVKRTLRNHLEYTIHHVDKGPLMIRTMCENPIIVVERFDLIKWELQVAVEHLKKIEEALNKNDLDLTKKLMDEPIGTD